MQTLVNTTVLSNFATVGRLDLLQTVFGILYLTQAVFEEIQTGLDEGYSHYAGIEAYIYPFHRDGWLHLTTIESEEELRVFQSLPAKLHRGEATSLAIAKCRRCHFLTDDRAARHKADELGIPKAGTLAVLVRAVRQSLISLEQGNVLLKQMIAAHYRSPIADLRDLL
jgi:predicted nucleic acid-binding protein